MFKNYLLISWRNLAKHKTFTGINILGLSVSLAVCLVLINLIYTHYQYDTFHEKGDHIYRVTTANKGESGFFAEIYATSPLPLGKELLERQSAVVNYTNLSKNFTREVESSHKILELKSLFADERFLAVFDFEVIAGDRDRALERPHSIVLKEDKAKLLFPNGDALGQTVVWREFGTYEVTAVVKEPSVGSHMAFDALISHVTMEQLIAQGPISDPGVWENIWQNYNYIQLAPGADVEALREHIQLLSETNMELEEDHPGYDFDLQALGDIVPGGFMANELGFALPGFILFFFGVLGMIVIVTASLNYTNLFVARAVGRLKEIGVRKVNGAARGQIVWQFLTESVMLMLLSLVVGIVLYRYLLTRFNELVIFNQFGMTLQDIPEIYLLFVVFAVVLGLITGLGPSLILSKANVISSLRNKLENGDRRARFFKMGWGRRSLTGLQFGLAIIVLLTVFVLGDQARFYVDSEYGFDEEQVFQLELQNNDPELVKTEFGKIAGVHGATLVSHHPAIGRSYGEDAKRAIEDEPITVYYFGVDESYVDVMGLQLVAGSNFPMTSNDREKFIILNETAVQRLGFQDNSDAVGQSIFHGDELRLVVRGVVKDYHWEPLMASIRPLALRCTPDEYRLAYFRVDETAGMQTYQRFEEVWQMFDPARDFRGGFLDAELDELYQVFFDIGKILSLIGILAISITALGFLGIVGYDLRTRTREIGIRRVLGATLQSLLLTLGRGYFLMLIIAFVVATPLAIMINNLWVGQMAYHAPIDFWNIAPAVLIVLGTGLLALLSQVVRRNNENPVKALRNE